MEPALYRKYRSRSLDEVVGQEHITSTLKKALASRKIAHAYLFSGPRGVGKTSVARILAHEVNRIPYSDDSAHLDIIEIDAASNRRIDEIRQLRERIHVAPALVKYKVYIIDEVHMLTREAFNALLKTLEEPPAHSLFILATTEVHKLPETIISRTQRFSFRPIEVDTAVGHLAAIAKSEKIKIDKAALRLLAEHADGSFRDSISLLNQLSATNHAVTEQAVRDLLGLPTLSSIKNLLDGVKSGDPGGAFKALERLWETGANPTVVSAELSRLIRQEVIGQQSENWSIQLLRQLLQVAASPQPKEQLEIAVLEAASGPGASQTAPTVRKSKSVKVTAIPSQAVEVSNKSHKPTPHPALGLDQWEPLLDEVKTKRASLYTALRLARPSIEGDTLTLAFRFPLHQRKVNEVSQRHLIEELVSSRTSGQVRVRCVVDKSVKASQANPIKSAPKLTDEPANLQTISSIFGQTEVLES